MKVGCQVNKCAKIQLCLQNSLQTMLILWQVLINVFLPRVTTLFGEASWTIDIKLRSNLDHLKESDVDC